jgi:hypothetical protein
MSGEGPSSANEAGEARSSPPTSPQQQAACAAPARKRSKKGDSDGTYKQNRSDNGTTQWSSNWVKDSNEKDIRGWLEKAGYNEKSQCWEVKCTLCDRKFQGKLSSITKHEGSGPHAAMVAAAAQREAAARMFMVADQRAVQQAVADKGLRNQLVALYKLMRQGRPVSDYVDEEREYQEALGVPDIAPSHWSSTSAWELVESLDAAVLEHQVGAGSSSWQE